MTDDIVARLRKERDALHAGLSAIIHCQSRLSRSEMREAAADLLDKTGLKPKWLGGDQSPFVRRALAAEARVRELEAEIADTYERCAKVADKIADEHAKWKGDAVSADAAEQVIVTLRARKNDASVGVHRSARTGAVSGQPIRGQPDLRRSRHERA